MDPFDRPAARPRPPAFAGRRARLPERSRIVRRVAVSLLAASCLHGAAGRASDASGAPASAAPSPPGPVSESASRTSGLAASFDLPPANAPFDVPSHVRFPGFGHVRARSPFDEPALGAALDGPAASADVFDEHGRRLAEHGIWLDARGPSPAATRLIERIADAGAHGLDPARYDLEGLRDGLVTLFERSPPSAVDDLDSPARAALAYRFGRAFKRLSTDLGRGLVDARAVQRRLYRDRPDPDIGALRAALARGELDVDAALAAVAPTHERYTRLVVALRELLVEREAGGLRTRVDVSGSLWAGHRHDDVMRLKRRLIETGDLPPDTVVTPMFDAPLVVAVEAFQRRHGIPPGGVVDHRTRRALNRTLEEDMDDLATSLERWRWMPRELGELHVFVNLPAYRLTLDNGTQRIVDMPVVIGATEHPTPSFSQDMSYMEFNPTWTVPASIARRELVPRERRNPGYLKSRNFDYLKIVDGRLEKVPHDSVGPEELALRPFPYVLRQRGGENNALGRMKFMMPNPYAIYLHDTQAKRHFTLHDRAYSHGCIRLSDPDRLATLLLQIDGRSRGEADGLIGSRETRRARLKRPVPTHLAYFTTWIDEKGRLQRREDVYGHDPAVRIALRANGALPSARFGIVSPLG